MSGVPDFTPGRESDPLVDEIRRIRLEVSERFDNDVDRLCEHLRVLEREAGDRVVTSPEKVDPKLP